MLVSGFVCFDPLLSKIMNPTFILELFQRIDKKEGVSYPVLVPNMKGFEAAVSNFTFNYT